jgi:hypothetical protein
MSGIFIQYGASVLNTTLRTATPTINSLSCFEQVDSTSRIRVPVKNEDGASVSMEVSLFSDFTNKQTATISAGATSNFDFDGQALPPGSVTAYARATATGKTTSITQSRTQSLNTCIPLP